MEDSLLWYVVHTHPKQEDRCDSNLRAWHVETFAPKLRERQYNQFTGKPTHLIKPLFPGYIFARFRVVDAIQKVRFTRGVHSVVSFGGGPTPVDDEIIEIIKARIGEDGFIKTGSDLRPGDKVTIKEGPMRDLAGVLEREVKASDRVMILLTSVSYQAHIMMERRMVKKASLMSSGL